jgi:uncharacterized protein (DUF302 family)
MKRLGLILLSALWLVQAQAANDNVRSWSTDQPLDVAYKVIYKHLEDNKFFVVFEPDIQSNLSHFAERWGEDYNRNKLEGIRAMVFCNGWYANQVSNADPTMLALCPLHITLIQEQGHSRVLFVRPSQVAAGSKAQTIARELEEDVAKAVNGAIDELRGCPATC